MASRIDEILEFLAMDGDFHSIEEVSTALNISYHVCETVATFLAKYDLVQYEHLKIKINPKIRDFITATSSKPVIELTPTE